MFGGGVRGYRPAWLVAGVALLVLLAPACGGGGDEEGASGDQGGAAEEEEEPGGPLVIDPTSGPAGTEITWTLSVCDPTDEKSASLYTGTPSQYQSGSTENVADGPEGGTDFSGTVAVPDGTPAGEYTVSVTCLSSTEPNEEGEVVLGVSEELAGFTVTG